MSIGAISTELTDFVHLNITSIEQLEILQLLHEEPKRMWMPNEFAERLYIQFESVSARLADLESKGFCICVPNGPLQQYRYVVTSADRGRLVQELVDAYRIRRVAIITLIFSKPLDPIDSFSDAFRIRRKE